MLAQEGDGAGAGDVDLFIVGAGEEEDGLGGVVVGEGVDGCLEGGEVGDVRVGVGVGDDESAWGALEGCLAFLASGG